MNTGVLCTPTDLTEIEPVLVPFFILIVLFLDSIESMLTHIHYTKNYYLYKKKFKKNKKKEKMYLYPTQTN